MGRTLPLTSHITHDTCILTVTFKRTVKGPSANCNPPCCRNICNGGMNDDDPRFASIQARQGGGGGSTAGVTNTVGYEGNEMKKPAVEVPVA